MKPLKQDKMRKLIEQIAFVVVIALITATGLFGAAYAGYAIGQQNGKLLGFYEAVEHINGLPQSEVCN